MSNEPTREQDSTTKEKAAAARAAAEAEQRKRDRRVAASSAASRSSSWCGLIIGVGGHGARRASSTATAPTDRAASWPTPAMPTGVFDADATNAWGVPYNDAAGKSTLAIWEDFQCPACAQFEDAAGAHAREAGRATARSTLVYRPTTFLDAQLPDQPQPDSSLRAAMACGLRDRRRQDRAIPQLVFENQPATEGDGWSNEQLIDVRQGGRASPATPSPRSRRA